ncbi:tryptophan transporter [Pradoshia sp.]
MNTKSLVTLSLLVGIGAVLHTVVPGFVFGMKPDLMLLMMFLGIFLLPDLKNALLIGTVTGIISALTTSFPGGQIPNIIDKIFTALIIYAIYTLVRKFAKPTVASLSLTFIGTLLSGTIFLSSAYLLVGLPGPFLTLAAGAILPALVINTVMMAFIYPIAVNILRRTNVAFTS